MELHFTRTNGPADEAIDRLMELVGGIHHSGIVREMILAALKAGQEDEEKADLKLMIWHTLKDNDIEIDSGMKVDELKEVIRKQFSK